MKIALISTNERFIDYGLRTISSCLKKDGFETKMIFMPTNNRYKLKNYSKKTLNNLYELVKDCQVIGFSSMSASYSRTLQIIKFLKSKTNSFFVWGGIHATLSPETCIEHVDAVCIGEGEEALCDLVKKINSKEDYLKIENFWFNHNKKIIKNNIRNLIQNLNSLPSPDYNLEKQYILQKDKFVCAKNFIKKNFWQLYSGKILILTARGCPYSCTYCSNNFLNKLYKGKGEIIRKQNIDKIIEELKYLKLIFPEAKRVFIDDDIFLTRNKDELIAFAEKYKKDINLALELNSTPNLIDEEKIKILVRAGLFHIVIGIQSGSKRICENIYKRPFTNEMILNAAKIINKYKVNISYDVIVSNPYEKEEDTLETINLLQRLPAPFSTTVFNLVYFPKTELRDKIEKENKFNDKLTYEYFDDIAHLFVEEKNIYLNNMLRCMAGNATKRRIGWLPRFAIIPLIRLSKTRFRWIGHYYLISVVLIKNFRNRAYFKIMSLIPKSLQDRILSFIRRNK